MQTLTFDEIDQVSGAISKPDAIRAIGAAVSIFPTPITVAVGAIAIIAVAII